MNGYLFPDMLACQQEMDAVINQQVMQAPEQEYGKPRQEPGPVPSGLFIKMEVQVQKRE